MYSYKDLEIWQLAREVVIEIHMMSIKLPRFEQFEEGQQIRRSSKSVKATIVEGFGRRVYKKEFLKFLIYAQASNDETIDHLENLCETGSLTDLNIYDSIKQKLIILGKKLNRFIQSVIKYHQSGK